ncbi:MAG TPA: hypothetical protein VFB31_00830 [Pseudolabrys sp.]|nr:hypothetical protein [Pseudolabrys sp.]
MLSAPYIRVLPRSVSIIINFPPKKMNAGKLGSGIRLFGALRTKVQPAITRRLSMLPALQTGDIQRLSKRLLVGTVFRATQAIALELIGFVR